VNTEINHIKKYYLGIIEILDFIILISSLVTLGSFILGLIFEGTNHLFIYINLFIGLLSLVIYVFRSKIPKEVKGTFLILAGILHSTLSFFTNATQGTGILVIIVIQIILLVTLEGKRSIFISALGLLPLILSVFLVYIEKISFGNEILVRANSNGAWLIALFSTISVYIIIAYSITSLKIKLFNQIDTIEKLSNLDNLTGFANKNYFINLMEKSLFYHIKNNNEDHVFLYLVRLENFRLIDSMYGHSKGDLVIKEIADALPKIVPEGAIFGRYSGSEFSVFSRISGQDILNLLEDHLDKMFPEMSLPLSLIQVAYPDGGKTVGELVSNLEITVKVGKENSIERFTEFNPSFLRELTLEKDMLYLLQRAVRNREFSVVYQNKVQTNTGVIHGVEALARWTSREMGSVSPDKFIPVLHKYNLMVDFSMVILDKILSEYHILEKNLGHGVKVSINISPTLFLFPCISEIYSIHP
jgi:diguanylate cyclase (GGDEF)-like protein